MIALRSANNHLKQTQANLEKRAADLEQRLLTLIPEPILAEPNHEPYFSITLKFSRHLLRGSHQGIGMHDLIIGEFRLRLRSLIQDRVSPMRRS